MYWTNNVFRLFKTCLWPWSFKTLNLNGLASLCGEVSKTTQGEKQKILTEFDAFTPVRAWVAKHREDWPREITDSTRAWWPSFLITHDTDISVTCQVNELLYLVDLLTYSLPAQKTLVVFKMLRREHFKALCQILVVLTLLDALASLQTSQQKRRTYDGWVIKKC